MLRRHLRPDRVEHPQPLEQAGVLCTGDRPGESLVEVMMSIHQTGENDVARQVHDLVSARRHVLLGSHLLDPAIAGEEMAVPQLDALVHRDEHVGIADQQCSHRRRTYLRA